MGAWGMGSFDNDGAFDWLFELADGGLGAVRAAFAAVDTSAYLEVDEGQHVIAAAEVLAALRGAPLDALPEDLTGWLSENPGLDPAPLIPGALKALERIQGAESELNELWEEGSNYAIWKAQVADLIRRLSESV